MPKRKICVVVASRANYGRVKSVLSAINQHEELELQLIVGASVLLYRFGNAIKVIEDDGFRPIKRISYVIEGENLETQAKSTGLGIIELSSAFAELKPDIVVTVADRFETMATAIAASYMNIPLAHIQGGEVTGNIDEQVRHAITKLAHYHFPSTQQSFERLIKLGEEKSRVFNTGCPSIDLLKNQNLMLYEDIFDKYGGVGFNPRINEKYILMVQHPVTSSYGKGNEQITETLEALREINLKKIVLWPNIDAGSDEIAKGIRTFREKYNPKDFAFHKNFSPEDYNRILNESICSVGNSSSFIREASFLGVPAVMIGNRQEGREHGKNVIFSNYNRNEIKEKILFQVNKGRFPQQTTFGQGNAGIQIANHLANVNLNINKRMTY